jgi:hypothetical protein
VAKKIRKSIATESRKKQKKSIRLPNPRVGIMWKVYSRTDDHADTDVEWEKQFRSTLGCGGSQSHPGKEWELRPSPISPVLQRVPMGIHPSARITAIYSINFWKTIEKHLPECLVGEVFVNKGLKEPSVCKEYVSLVMPLKHTVECYRGRYCRHFVCVGGCGRFGNRISWASGAIVKRDLGSRLACMDDDFSIYLHPDIVKSLDLRRSFPDLMLYRVDVVEEPLDGDILPGDPGWTGTFKERRSPPLPKTPLRRGRWTDD